MEFLLIVAYVNATRMKKVAIVKDYLAPLLDNSPTAYTSLGTVKDLNLLKLLLKYMESNNKMLI